MKKVSAVVIIGGLALVSGLCLATLDSSAADSASSKTKREACESKLSAKAQDELKKRRAAYASLTSAEKNDVKAARAEGKAQYYKLSLPAQTVLRTENQGKKPDESNKDALKEAASYQTWEKERMGKLSGKEQAASAQLSSATKQELISKCGPRKSGDKQS